MNKVLVAADEKIVYTCAFCGKKVQTYYSNQNNKRRCWNCLTPVEQYAFEHKDMPTECKCGASLEVTNRGSLLCSVSKKPRSFCSNIQK